MPVSLRPIQSSFAAGELSPALHARVDLAKYTVGAKQLKNFFVHPHGGASNRPGTKFVALALGKTRLISFQFNVVQTYILEFSDLKMRIIKDGGLVVYPSDHESAGEIVEITSPYSAEDLDDLKTVQSADTVFLTHPNHAPHELTRTDHHEWTFTEMTFEPGISPPTDLSGSYTGSGSFTVKYIVSAVSPDGEESLPSDAASVDAETSGNWEAGKVVDLSWTNHSDAEYYNVYKNTRGYYGWIGRANSNAFTDDNISPDVSDGPQNAKNPFADDNNPGCAGIYEQRLVFGRTNNDPQTVWASQTGVLRNFSTSRPLKDSDAIEATLAALQVNEIKYFIPFDELLIFTSGGEWIMSSGANADALTPTSVQFQPQGYRGCGNVRPLVVGNSILFVQRGGNIVRDMQYKLEVDKYTGGDMTVLSQHLFRGRQIVSWAYYQNPDSLIWVVLDNGQLLSFTYLAEHEVWAWCPQETQGNVENVAVISGEDEDEAYFIIKREIDGVETRFVEKLDTRQFTTVEDAYFVDCGLSYNGWNDDADKTLTISEYESGGYEAGAIVTVSATGHAPFASSDVGWQLFFACQGCADIYMTEITEYVDSSTVRAELLHSLPDDLQDTATEQWAWAVSSLSGLDHLAGEEVAILADGNVHPPQVVDSSGEISLDYNASVVQAGLPYTATLETLNIDFSGDSGTVQGLKKAISSLVIRMEKTRGIWVGPHEDRLTELPFRTFEGYDEPTRLYTGDKEMKIKPSWDRGGRIMIQQNDPLPVTVLAIIPTVNVASKG